MFNFERKMHLKHSSSQRAGQKQLSIFFSKTNYTFTFLTDPFRSSIVLFKTLKIDKFHELFPIKKPDLTSGLLLKT